MVFLHFRKGPVNLEFFLMILLGQDPSTEDGNQVDEERQVIFTKTLCSNRGMNTDADQIKADNLDQIDEKNSEPVIAIRL